MRSPVPASGQERPALRLFDVVTALWALNLIAARVVTKGLSTIPSGLVILVYAMLAAAAVRVWQPKRRVRLEAAELATWMPFLFLTVFYDYHSLVPRLPLLMVVGLAASASLFRTSSPLLGPVLSLTALTSLVCLVDVLWPHASPTVILEKHPARYWQPDSLLGYRPVADTTVHVICWRQERRVYDVTLRFDREGRRVTLDSPAEPTPFHAIFAGNSCMFGENVGDHETLPSHFAAATAGYAVYNYGFIGYGPQQALALVESGRLAEEVSERQGIMVYGVQLDHVRRANGSYTATAWGEQFPRYDVRGSRAVRVGSFAATQPRRMALFRLLRSSPLLDFAARRLDRALGTRPNRWRPLLMMMRQCAAEYERQFQGRFIAFVWPSDERYAHTMVDSLRSHGLLVADLAAAGLSPPRADQLVPYDPHPNGSYYQLAASALNDALSKELRRTGQSARWDSSRAQTATP